jgi:hypothetical protein
MTNRELLERNIPKDLLTVIEQQERFILRQGAMAKPCPNCAQPVNQFDAAGIDVNEFDVASKVHSDYQYHCPRCKRELLFILPLIGGWVWMLRPVTVERAEAAQ